MDFEFSELENHSITVIKLSENIFSSTEVRSNKWRKFNAHKWALNNSEQRLRGENFLITNDDFEVFILLPIGTASARNFHHYGLLVSIWCSRHRTQSIATIFFFFFLVNSVSFIMLSERHWSLVCFFEDSTIWKFFLVN